MLNYNFNELFLFSHMIGKINDYTFKDIYYISILVFIYYSYSYIIENVYKLLKYIFDIYFDKTVIINIIGWEFLSLNHYTFEYPLNMLAINNYIYINNKAKDYNYYNMIMNGKKYYDNFEENSELNNNYLLNDIIHVCIYTDIYLSLTREKIEFNGDGCKSLNWKILMKLKSYNHDNRYIEKFINKCIIDYENYNKDKNKNKTYHFVYQGNENNKPQFSSTLISDFTNLNYQNYESFDNLFHKHKESLIKDIERLKDINYYKKTGLKRKKGYLFYGPPGCGKTSTVMAISNYDKRHIIEIPLSRVKTNNDFEKILNLSEINNLKINFNNIIILFDELDIGTTLDRNNNDIPNQTSINLNNENILNQNMINQNNDKLCLNTLLSRLDGIGNYNGLIIIGTSNNIDNIDKSLYREGRLNLMKFDYASFNDIIYIIEKYYDSKLNENQIEIIKNINNLSHSKLICKLEENDEIENLLSIL